MINRLSDLPIAPTASEATQPSGLRKVAQEFESLLLTEVFKAMRQTVPEGMGTGGAANEFFQDMFDSHIANEASDNGLGLADALIEQLGGSSGEPTAHGTALLSDGNWTLPLDQTNSRPNPMQRFGALRPGERPSDCGAGHCGLDLAAETGLPVHVVRDGVIEAISHDPDSPGGLSVTVRHQGKHGAVLSRYFHLDEVRSGLTAGSAVSRGEELGKVGQTGTSAHGSHLHWELIEALPSGERRFIDPEHWLSSWKKPIKTAI